MALAGVQAHVVEIKADIEKGLAALLLSACRIPALREACDPAGKVEQPVEIVCGIEDVT